MISRSAASRSLMRFRRRFSAACASGHHAGHATSAQRGQRWCIWGSLMKRVQRESATRLVPRRVVCRRLAAFLAAAFVATAGLRGVGLCRRRLQLHLLPSQRVRWPHRLPRAESQQLRERALRVLLPRLAVRKHGGQRGRVQLLLRYMLSSHLLLCLHGAPTERRRRRGAQRLHPHPTRARSGAGGALGTAEACFSQSLQLAERVKATWLPPTWVGGRDLIGQTPLNPFANHVRKGFGTLSLQQPALMPPQASDSVRTASSYHGACRRRLV